MNIPLDKKTEFKELFDKFFATFGDIIPLMQLDGVTYESLKENVVKCFEANKNLLPEIYGWVDDGNKIY